MVKDLYQINKQLLNMYIIGNCHISRKTVQLQAIYESHTSLK